MIKKANLQWARPLTNLDLTKVDSIAIHHAAHPTWGVKEIHEYHMNSRDWKGHGYNYEVDKDGTVWEIRGYEYEAGGLTGEHNKTVLSVVFQGDFDKETMSDKQFNAGVYLLAYLKTQLPQIKRIGGHKEWENTSCPGKHFPLQKMIDEVNNAVYIMGEPIVKVEQMRKFLRNVNPNAPEGIEEMYIEEGRIEGVRGDIAFCQAIHETNYFRFTGIAKPEWHNPAGLGVTGAKDSNGEYVGNKFPDWRIGVRAHIQHLKAYASTEPLNNPCVDQRFSLVKRGSAITWTDLNGKWAVPGTTYGQSILALYEKIKAIPVETDSDKIKALEEENARLKNEVTRLNNLLSEIEIVLHKR